jgi:hypothetical protein
MTTGAESHETGRLPGEDEMANKTPVISPAEGPPTHESWVKRVEEELANPDLAETREMVTKYIKEPEDMKNTGDGMGASRCHEGTVLMIYGVQRKDFKKIRILLAAEGTFVPDMTHLKRCGFFTTAHYHEDDWKSPNGRMSEEKTWLLEVIVPHSQASHGAKDYAGDLEEAWKKIENIPGAKAFIGEAWGPTQASSTFTWPAGVWVVVRSRARSTRRQR